MWPEEEEGTRLRQRLRLRLGLEIGPRLGLGLARVLRLRARLGLELRMELRLRPPQKSSESPKKCPPIKNCLLIILLSGDTETLLDVLGTYGGHANSL